MEIEDVISYALIAGVVISIALIILGVALIFIHGGAQGFTIYQIGNVHSLVNTSTTSPPKVVQGLSKLDGLSFIYLGLIVLISTPVVRVALLIGDFVKNRDLLYTILSLIVLINIMIAIFIVPAFVIK
ncbi:DUF1634 domain-containing protein [Metallosphaera hakonensis]|uniref:DUF1634 domain-containing protein n=1 Tax=Metallosphaera hakonensis JCM 8857 = DSM 7519 TaxID=1293036 RepID=A0A2U9ISW8_9CREN|nr:DUF1634 domain-containing protein [Metallosphaera hakonensis]AWR99149.1 DUF1634 domain-containing protein [Metallosphaera hakonensis JCM 8857 = DSM 7519]